jgi:hypothetical protein
MFVGPKWLLTEQQGMLIQQASLFKRICCLEYSNSIIVVGIEAAHWRVSVLCGQSKCAATLPHPEINDKEIFKELTRKLGPPVRGSATQPRSGKNVATWPAHS